MTSSAALHFMIVMLRLVRLPSMAKKPKESSQHSTFKNSCDMLLFGHFKGFVVISFQLATTGSKHETENDVPRIHGRSQLLL